MDIKNNKAKWYKARELEIEYNFLFRKTWGTFPNIVDRRYCEFCISKGIMPKGPSIKCGYVTNWRDYGKTLDEAIERLTRYVKSTQLEYDQIKEEDGGSTPFERSGGYMSQIAGLGDCR